MKHTIHMTENEIRQLIAKHISDQLDCLMLSSDIEFEYEKSFFFESEHMVIIGAVGTINDEQKKQT